jgi:PilZ domain
MWIFELVRGACLSLLRRRAHRRTAAPVLIDWHAFGSAVHHRTETVDLSSGGAMMRSEARVPPGSPLVVALSTPRGTTLLHARVAWSEATQMGLRFTRPRA